MIDCIVVGSGFGGSVCALRLAEAGNRVLVLEQGRRFHAADFARTNWDLRRWLWAPALGLRGPFRMSFLPHVTALSGVGVGGGSLVYGNTLEQPGRAFFEASPWRGLRDWERELSPHYDTARRMLGATANPRLTWADEALRAVAGEIGRSDAFAPTQTGVYFGQPGESSPDPYFDGRGPARTGCTFCGSCMLGCRVGAKNTLDRNYLHLAESHGAEVRPLHEVVWIEPVAGGYEVSARVGPATWGRRRRLERYRARRVVLAAGVLGTTRLLLRLQRSASGLPKLSRALGRNVRTNSEVLIGVVSRRRDRALSEGLAITSILRTDERSSIEPVRYADGSGFFRLLCLPHATGATVGARLAGVAGRVLREPAATLRTLLVPDLARHSIILLYMRTDEGTLALDLAGGRLRSRVTEGLPPSAALPEASELAERVARQLDGYTISLFTELLFGVPTTAHILGGCGIGESPDAGVVDAEQRVHGYPGLYVADGSVVPANPGVNPSLTITALAERAVAAWAHD